MRVTIRDVARKARVAVGTVSRVINGYPDVDPRLRENVEKAMRQLKYRPNVRAQSFARNASRVISFVLSNRDFLHPVHSRILQGVEQYCEEAGYLVVFTKFDYAPLTPARELRLPKVLCGHGVADCFILSGNNYANLLEAVESLGVPYVLMGNNYISDRPRPAVDQVRTDDYTGAYEAVRYLIQLGHRRICYVGDGSLPWFQIRHEAYLRAMADHSLKPCSHAVALSDNNYGNGWAQAEHILQHTPHPTAVFCGADEVAYAVCDRSIQNGLHIPEDLSVLGFGDEENARFKVPPLTTVRVDTVQMGRHLAKLAIQKLGAPEQSWPEVVLPTSLVKRGTVNTPPARF